MQFLKKVVFNMSILFDMLTLKSNVYLPFVISPEFPHAELIASDIE